MDKNTVNSSLSALGLDGNAHAVVRCLIEEQALSASELCKHSQLPRSSMYAAIETLMREELVTKRYQGRKPYFSLASPTAFMARLERKREELKRQELAALQLGQFLEQRAAQSLPVSQMAFHYGKREVEKFLYERIDTWRTSITLSDHTWWGYQDDQFVEQYMRWLNHAWSSSPQSEQVRLFSNPTAKAQEDKRNVRGRIIKPVPEGFAFSTTIWIIGEYIVLISTRAKPHYLVEMRDAMFSASLRDTFRLLWHFSTN